MDALLDQGTAVTLRSNHLLECRVVGLIGSGGQGEVYRLRIASTQMNGDFALKWYFPEWATRRQLANLSRVIDQGPPNRRFLWPMDLASIPSRPGFGYVMPIRARRFVSCCEIMSCRREIGFRQLLLAGVQLADGFLQLHARGLCYRDISFGNVFIDPATGDVLVVDNDNVGPDGDAGIEIRGTGSFMAPEVMMDKVPPGIAADLYSLSVLLFYLLMTHHPLEGRRLTTAGVIGPDEGKEVYGRSPLFIFDPDDDSNRPEPDHDANALTYWAIYPERVRDLFTQAFTVGLREPSRRVPESQWRDCLAELADLLVVCGCGASVFAHPDTRETQPCWSCGLRGDLPRLGPDGVRWLELDKAGGPYLVGLHDGKELTGHHIGDVRFDYRHALARVERHPEAPGVYGLRNLTSNTWTARTEQGPVSVAPRHVVRIAADVSVAFGPVTGWFVTGRTDRRV